MTDMNMTANSKELEGGSKGYLSEKEEECCPHCGKPNNVQQCVDCERWFSGYEIVIVQARHTKGSYSLCFDCYGKDVEDRLRE